MCHEGVHVAEAAIVHYERTVRRTSLDDIPANADAVHDGESGTIMALHQRDDMQRVADGVVGSDGTRGLASPAVVVHTHVKPHVGVEAHVGIVRVVHFRDAWLLYPPRAPTCIRRGDEHALSVEGVLDSRLEHDTRHGPACHGDLVDAGGVEARLAVKEEKKADEAALKHGEGHEEGVLAPEEGGDGAPEVGLAEQDTGVGERWSGEGGGGLGVRRGGGTDECVETVALGFDGAVEVWM